MKSKEFDDIVRQKFENARLPYNHENWQKLSAVLDQKKERNLRLLLWPLASIAASVAMAIGIFTWVGRNDKEVVQATKQGTHHTTQHIATAPPQQQPVQDLAPIPLKNNTVRQSNPAPATPQNKAIAQTPSVLQNRIIQEQRALPIVHQAPVTARIAEEQISTFRAEKDPVIAKNSEPVRSLPLTNNNVFYEEVITKRKDRDRFIAIAGGLNYGTLNSGYVMGLSAGTKIGGGKFYVESDVAFVGNMANEKNRQTFKTKSSSLGKTTSYNTSTVTVQRFYNLYYAQVTPTIGYRVAPSISVGVGADVQKLLINDILVTETDNPDDAKQLPSYDMGLVGKTEYSVTKEIKASVYYRKAVNRELSGNNNFLNRDYLQLQLKFALFNR
jgi:hypothetical protein